MLFNAYQLIIIVVFFILFALVKKENIQSVTFFNKDYTTIMRGIAILFVVLHHVGNSSGSVIFTPLGGIGVAMFLIISGYGLHESLKKKGLNNYWKNKVVRVIIPMLIVEFVSIIINECDRSGLQDTIKHLFCIDRNWYVRYLFYWYFLFYLAVRLLKKRYEYVLLCIGFVMLVSLPEIEAEQSLSFVAGIFLSLYKDKINLTRRQILAISIILLFVGSSCLFAKQLPIIRTYSGTVVYSSIQMCLKFSIACSVLLFSSLLFSSHILQRGVAFLYVTGIMSYEIYLVHCKLLGIVYANNTILHLILFYILTYLISYMLYLVDQRITIRCSK